MGIILVKRRILGFPGLLFLFFKARGVREGGGLKEASIAQFFKKRYRGPELADWMLPWWGNFPPNFLLIGGKGLKGTFLFNWGGFLKGGPF